MLIWRSPSYSPLRERRRIVALHATYKRVETRIAPELLARLEALCVRPEGSWRPSRACVLAYIISLGVGRAETIYRAAMKSQAAHRARRAAKAMKQAINGGAW